MLLFSVIEVLALASSAGSDSIKGVSMNHITLMNSHADVLSVDNQDSTNITGDDAGWGDGYNLIYRIDGLVYKTIVCESGASIIAEPAPTKEGYTFSGWSEIPGTMPAQDVEVIGSFSINSYQLVYKVDGAEFKTLTLDYGTEITPESAPTKEGYTFSGWSSIPETMPANDIEITGAFSINSYKLTYVVDGSEYKTYAVEFGSAITNEPAPTKEGFTFSGWSEIPETMPANDIEITGAFSINSYKLTYVVDDSEYKTYTVEYGSTITAEPVPTKEGFTFSGWSEIPETMPAKDVEVTGTFGLNTYSLVYKVDGEIYKSFAIEYGAQINAEPAPTKEGYTFSGWSEIPATMPANDVEVTGSFSINSYKLVYKVYGTEFKTLTLDYGTEITVESNPTKEGYTFSGWSEIPATMPANEVEIIGYFTVNKYLLTVLVDNQIYYSDSIAYGTRLADYVELITQNGIDLSKWDLYNSIDSITMPAHDITINAIIDAVSPIMNGIDSIIYDLTGKRIDSDDISTLPLGIFIRNGRKIIVR